MITIRKQTLGLDDVEVDHDYVDCTFRVSNQPIRISDVTFDHCQFEQTNFDQSDWNFVVFKGCQFLNASFHQSYFSNSQFIGSQLMGADFSVGTKLTNVSVTDTNLRYANFSESTMVKVHFNQVNLQETAFQAVTLKKGLVFSQCNLDQSDFLDTKLKGIDLSQSRFETLTVSPELIRGLIINPWQARSLIGLLGVVVKDD
ncbi:pentapeptide repeat-containing protein [Lentilactobacillus raoultii]|uniref:Pentapeptide repeat-containing protein n=1 Tax=Lentilactobacillus raoultii TaxID=1987503 RepID=A0ABW3PM94_9LACO|nr:pentapeptide repeat-containing protein [Lentilactobacillus raoultii]